MKRSRDSVTCFKDSLSESKIVATVKNISKQLKASCSTKTKAKESDTVEVDNNANDEVLQDLFSHLRYQPEYIQTESLSLLYNVSLIDPHKNVFIRRAAFLVSHQLLLRSKVCRETLNSGDNINVIISSILNIPHFSTTTAENGIINLKLLYQEAVQSFQQLSTLFGSFYPKMIVATRYLLERRGLINIKNLTKTSLILFSQSLTGNNNGNTSEDHHGFLTMAELRQYRDQGLAQGSKCAEKVFELVHTANFCFEQMVPSFKKQDVPIFLDKSPTVKESNYKVSYDDSSSSESEIDWVDGDDSIDDQENFQVTTSHLENVSKTLDTTANGSSINYTISNNGFEFQKNKNDNCSRVSIGDIGNNGEEFSISDEIFSMKKSNNDVKEKTLQSSHHSLVPTLQDCVNELALKHLPLVRKLVEGLISADNLKIVVTKSASFSQEGGVYEKHQQLSQSEKDKRCEILRLLMDCKSVITSTLASASKLDVLPKLNRSNPKKDKHFMNQSYKEQLKSTTTSRKNANTPQIQRDPICWSRTIEGEGFCSKRQPGFSENCRKLRTSKLKIKLKK